MDHAVELADFIWKLRSELTRAMFAGEDKDVRFRAETVELEMRIAVEQSSDPSVRMRLWVLDGAAGRRHSDTTTQTVRVVLHPVSRDSPDDALLITGAAYDDER